jgi:hypothetical protein
LAFVCLATLGMLTYILYLSAKFGAPLAFLEAQAFWGREFNGLLPAIFEAARKLAHMNWLTGYDGVGVPIRWRLLLEFSSLIAAIVSGILAWKRFGEYLGLFVLIGILLLASSSFDSLPRYFLVLFPPLSFSASWENGPGLTAPSWSTSGPHSAFVSPSSPIGISSPER